MGKITSIYLTDEEAIALKKFWEENRCTQYSALKTALKELISKPVKGKEEKPSIKSEIGPIQKSPEELEAEEKQERKLRKLLELLKQVRSQYRN